MLRWKHQQSLLSTPPHKAGINSLNFYGIMCIYALAISILKVSLSSQDGHNAGLLIR